MATLEWNRAVLLDQTGENEILAAELLELFKDSSAADFRNIREGLADKKPAVLAEAAHSIKGSAASLGIEGISNIAARIEQAGRREDLEGAAREADLLGDLLKEVGKLTWQVASE